jgi:hypothetical protein
MEQPTPCTKCGQITELNDMAHDTLYCPECDTAQQEMQEQLDELYYEVLNLNKEAESIQDDIKDKIEKFNDIYGNMDGEYADKELYNSMNSYI